MVPISLALALAGALGFRLEDPPPQPAPSARAELVTIKARVCDAMRAAVTKDVQELTGQRVPDDPAVWGKCDGGPNDQVISGNKTRWSTAIAVKIPHVDENGKWKPDTFYYGDIDVDRATGEAVARDVVHN